MGALLSRAYAAGGCLLGAIFGTGTNGAYVEEVCEYLDAFTFYAAADNKISQNKEALRHPSS